MIVYSCAVVYGYCLPYNGMLKINEECMHLNKKWLACDTRKFSTLVPQLSLSNFDESLVKIQCYNTAVVLQVNICGAIVFFCLSFLERTKSEHLLCYWCWKMFRGRGLTVYVGYSRATFL